MLYISDARRVTWWTPELGRYDLLPGRSDSELLCALSLVEVEGGHDPIEDRAGSEVFPGHRQGPAVLRPDEEGDVVLRGRRLLTCEPVVDRPARVDDGDRNLMYPVPPLVEQ